jgi:hypothetical protein
MPPPARSLTKRRGVSAGQPQPTANSRSMSTGDYMRDAGQIIGGGAAMYLGGNPAMARLGAAIGRGAGSLISRITGNGAYQVSSNSIMDSGAVPTFMSSSDGLRVCHREFIQDIQGSVGFVNNSIPINPGLGNFAPWLALLAQLFDEWEPRGIVMEYRPTSGTAINAASPALGVVMYATNYDCAEPIFTTKQQMESYEFSSSTVPYTGMLHPVECAKGANVVATLYTRNGPVPVGSTPQLFDLGTFQFATQSMPAVYTIGEMWVTYDILFKRPRMNPNTTNTYYHVSESPNTSATAARPFGTGPAVNVHSASDLLGVTFVQPNLLILSQPGNYYISGTWVGFNIASVALTNNGANITNNVVFTDSAFGGASAWNTNNTSFSVFVTVSNPGTAAANTITLTGPGAMTAGSTDIFVFAAPTNIN